MKLYFAAVGYELWDSAVRAHEDEEMDILFSFYDITMSGFQFRTKSWYNFVKERRDDESKKIRIIGNTTKD